MVKHSTPTTSIGKCRRCRQPVPNANIDGTPVREGVEYKEIKTISSGGEPVAPDELYHHRHPLFPDCWQKEKEDPTSPWWDGNFLDRDDDPFVLDFEDDHDYI